MIKKYFQKNLVPGITDDFLLKKRRLKKHFFDFFGQY